MLVLGLPKCGTTSLHEAFTSAGFQSVHWALKVGENMHADVNLRKYGIDADSRLIAKLIHRAVCEGVAPLTYLPREVDAVAEMNGIFWDDQQPCGVWGYFPQVSILEELVAHYPNAYFVLNVRDHWRWVKSVKNHCDMRDRLVAADIPGLPSGVGGTDEELVQWAAAHHERVRRLLIARRLRFLDFDIERHGALELSSFFGRHVEWGKHNVT